MIKQGEYYESLESWIDTHTEDYDEFSGYMSIRDDHELVQAMNEYTSTRERLLDLLSELLRNIIMNNLSMWSKVSDFSNFYSDYPKFTDSQLTTLKREYENILSQIEVEFSPNKLTFDNWGGNLTQIGLERIKRIQSIQKLFDELLKKADDITYINSQLESSEAQEIEDSYDSMETDLDGGMY